MNTEEKPSQAMRAYRAGKATLSRAAEMAGTTTRDFLARMESNGIELNYGVEEFDADLTHKQPTA